MATESFDLTTYYAKRIIGDSAANTADNALLQTGDGVTTNTWILNRTNRTADYGILYTYNSTNGDKIEFVGGTNGTTNAWIKLDTGEAYFKSDLNVDGTINVYNRIRFTDPGYAPNHNIVGWLGVSSDHSIQGLYSYGYYKNSTDGFIDDAKYLVYRNNNGKIYLNGNADSATQLRNLGRLADANITRTTDGGVRFFLASSSMTSNKPTEGDGFILHYHWDGNDTNGWDAQLFVPDLHSKSIQWRGHTNATTWGTEWHTLIDEKGGTITGLLTLGQRETDTAPSSLTGINRLAFEPYYHTGGPWYLRVEDESSTAYFSLLYDSNRLFQISHAGKVLIGNTSINSEVAVFTTSSSGQVAIYSTGNANSDGNRGLWFGAHGTGSSISPIICNTNNIISMNANYIGIRNTSGTTGYGLSLYDGPTDGLPMYGIVFAQTATFGGFGDVAGNDWATYFTMSRHDNRGWIFKSNGSTKDTNNNYASISGRGHFSASLTPTSWIDGQRYTVAAYNIATYSNTGSYNPWMRAINTWSSGEESAKVGRWFSFGTLGTRFYWIGSVSTRTVNSYDNGMSYDVSDGKLYAGTFVGNLTGKVNNITLTAQTTGFTIAGGTTSKTLTVSQNCTLNGGSASYLAYYSAANSISGHGAAHFSDTYSSSTANGKNELVLGNSTGKATNGSAWGQLALYSEGTQGTYLKSAENSTAWYTATLPAASGTICYTNGTGANGTWGISITGNAATATALTSNAGSTTSPIYFTGGKPSACAQPKSGAWYSSVPMIGSDGVMEIGKYIDFHDGNTSTADYSARITATSSGLTLSGTTTGTFSGNVTGNCSGSSGSCTGNAATATCATRTGVSVGWHKGRDAVVAKTTTVSGYCPTISVKTTNGSWEIGSYNDSSYTDKLIFSYVTDANYNSNTNYHVDFTITTGGYFSGSCASSAACTGNAATATTAGAISNLTSNDQASSSATQRYVWFCYDNNTTGRPAYSTNLTFQSSTGTLTAKALTASAGNVNSPAGSMWAGTKDSTAAERQVGVQAGSGQLYLYAQAGTSASRGLYAPAHGTGGAISIITVNTNNSVTFTGSLSGTASKASDMDRSITTITITGVGCSFRKCGHMVFFNLQGTTNAASSANTDLSITIPAGYRPEEAHWYMLNMGRTSMGRIGFWTNGAIQFNQAMASGTMISAEGAYICS